MHGAQVKGRPPRRTGGRSELLPDEFHVTSAYSARSIVDSERVRVVYLDVDLVAKVDEYDVCPGNAREALCYRRARSGLQAHPLQERAGYMQHGHEAHATETDRITDSHDQYSCAGTRRSGGDSNRSTIGTRRKVVGDKRGVGNS